MAMPGTLHTMRGAPVGRNIGGVAIVDMQRNGIVYKSPITAALLWFLLLRGPRRPGLCPFVLGHVCDGVSSLGRAAKKSRRCVENMYCEGLP